MLGRTKQAWDTILTCVYVEANAEEGCLPRAEILQFCAEYYSRCTPMYSVFVVSPSRRGRVVFTRIAGGGFSAEALVSRRL